MLQIIHLLKKKNCPPKPKIRHKIHLIRADYCYLYRPITLSKKHQSLKFKKFLACQWCSLTIYSKKS